MCEQRFKIDERVSTRMNGENVFGTIVGVLERKTGGGIDLRYEIKLDDCRGIVDRLPGQITRLTFPYVGAIVRTTSSGLMGEVTAVENSGIVTVTLRYCRFHNEVEEVK